MFKFKKYLNLEYLIFFLIMFIIILLFTMYSNYFYLESFGSITPNDGDAFQIPTAKKWILNQSNDWYSPVPGRFSIQLKDTGMTIGNPNMSILFLLNVLEGQRGYWRNIFLFSNSGGDGTRNPALYIWPDGGAQLHLRNQTPKDWNAGINSNFSLPIGIPAFIGIVYAGDYCYLYINNILNQSVKFDNIVKRTNNTILYIGCPGYNYDGKILIKNFTIYDDALSKDDIKNVYDKLDKAPGPPGEKGRPGQVGPVGQDGKNGIKGPVGVDGNDGPQGPQGTVGPQGHTGATGPAAVDNNIQPMPVTYS
jgi:hypothetical protein